MPLLHRGELLERQRVDLAQHGEVALGGLEPLLLLGADVRRRLLGAGRSPPRPEPASAAGRAGPVRTRRSATSASTPNSSIARASICSMRSRCSVRATSSRWTESVSCSSSAAISRERARTASSSASSDRPAVLGRRPCLGRQLKGPVEPAADDVAGTQRRPWPPPPPARRARRAAGLLARGALVRGGAVELVGAAVQSPRPLLAGPHARAAPRSPPRGPTIERRAPAGLAAAVSGSPTSGACLGGREPLLELVERGQRVVVPLHGRRDGRLRRASASAAADRAAEPSCPSCSATADRRASDSCSRTSAASTRCWASCSAAVLCVSENRSRSHRCVVRDELLLRLVDGGLHLQQARRV